MTQCPNPGRETGSQERSPLFNSRKSSAIAFIAKPIPRPDGILSKDRRDESGTLARLRQNRAERLDPILVKYGGRLVKLTVDGALIETREQNEEVSALGVALGQ